MESKTKVVPIPDCPLSPEIVLLVNQIREEMAECLAVPEHLLKPEEVSAKVRKVQHFLEMRMLQSSFKSSSKTST